MTHRRIIPNVDVAVLAPVLLLGDPVSMNMSMIGKIVEMVNAAEGSAGRMKVYSLRHIVVAVMYAVAIDDPYEF